VLIAFKMLTGEAEVKDSTYKPALYEGFECCDYDSLTKMPAHIHLPNDKDLIASLISRAEPELLGERPERHAKTLDLAQEEVLTCIGLYLYERFSSIAHVVKVQERSWWMLLYLSVLSLKNNIQVILLVFNLNK
jgi:hypothetical protein